MTLSQSEMVGEKIEEILTELKRGQLLFSEHLLSYRQAAELLDCSVDYVRKLVELGELERHDIARDSAHPMWRILHSDVMAFIERVKTGR
jgi:excisionase family DNA binding protein